MVNQLNQRVWHVEQCDSLDLISHLSDSDSGCIDFQYTFYKVLTHIEIFSIELLQLEGLINYETTLSSLNGHDLYVFHSLKNRRGWIRCILK